MKLWERIEDLFTSSNYNKITLECDLIKNQNKKYGRYYWESPSRVSYVSRGSNFTLGMQTKYRTQRWDVSVKAQCEPHRTVHHTIPALHFSVRGAKPWTCFLVLSWNGCRHIQGSSRELSLSHVCTWDCCYYCFLLLRYKRWRFFNATPPPPI